MFQHRSRGRVRRAGIATIAAVVVVGGAAAGGALRSAPTPIGTPPSEITPLAATVLAPIHPIVADDNRQHLAYELFITNPTSSVMRLTKIDTLDPKDKVGSISGADLEQAIRPLVPSTVTTLQPAQVSRVFMDTTFAGGASLPDALAHEFTFTLTPTTGAPTTHTVVSARSAVIDDKALEISSPIEGKRWLTAGGCCFPPSYHRAATLPVNGAFHGPERYAIDFVQLNGSNQLFAGPVGDLESYAYFGSKVMSVADGRVVGELNGIPESDPPNFPDGATAQTAGGNYLMIDIGHGRFAYYAHLQPGSLRVHVGDRVREGQVIGLLGNTGNSNGPHLHFQISDTPIPLASEGLPFVFKKFTTRGTVTNADDVEGGTTATITPVNAGRHRDQYPLQNELVDFPKR